MTETLLHPGVGTAGIIAVMGYLVVFFGLILLLAVVSLMGRIMVASRKKASAQSVPAGTEAAPAPDPVPARGTAGELMLHDVDPRDAALIMAIVAHNLGKPVNELRFRSIKEVKDK